MVKNQIFYFGCWGGKGHFLWNAYGRKCSQQEEEMIPFVWYKLDGSFVADHNKWKQGNATLTVVDDHTILSFPDNSVDARSASHSTFIAGGVLSFNAILELS